MQSRRSDLDRALLAALQMQQQRENSGTRKDDQQQNENKNQGLINTI
ncbi:unnamed protein product, partial [Rotaria magnacalcarata]